MNKHEVEQKIRAYMANTRRADSQKLDPHQDLFATGVMDSLALAGFVAFLETTFDVKFEDRYFFDPRFSNLAGLTEIIGELKSG